MTKYWPCACVNRDEHGNMTHIRKPNQINRLRQGARH